MEYNPRVQGPEFDGFTWDAEKSERCYQDRGFDFEYAVQVFEGDLIEWEDRRRDFGEQRFVTVGQVDGKVLAIVWTPRSNLRRIISARPASRSERDRFNATREANRQGDP